MIVPLESSISTSMVKWTNHQPGCWAFKTHGGMYGKSGIPDVIACIHGTFVAAEVKRPAPYGTPVSALQQQTLNAITGADGIAVVCRSLKEWQEDVQTVLHSAIHGQGCFDNELKEAA